MPPPPIALLVQLGDLTDYGPDNAGALRIMFRLIDQGRGLFLLGNHDFKLARFLAGQHVRNDWPTLDATLAQLDATLRERVVREVASAPAWLRTGDTLFVHGGFHTEMLDAPAPEHGLHRPHGPLARALYRRAHRTHAIRRLPRAQPALGGPHPARPHRLLRPRPPQHRWSSIHSSWRRGRHRRVPRHWCGQGRASVVDRPVTTNATVPVALVTGGANGIGAGIAQRLARDGWRIVVADLDPAGMAPSGGRYVVCDASEETAVNALVAGIAAQEGRLDALICNAGVNIRKPIARLTLAEWSRVIGTNSDQYLPAGPCGRGAAARRQRFCSDDRLYTRTYVGAGHRGLCRIQGWAGCAIPRACAQPGAGRASELHQSGLDLYQGRCAAPAGPCVSSGGPRGNTARYCSARGLARRRRKHLRHRQRIHRRWGCDAEDDLIRNDGARRHQGPVSGSQVHIGFWNFSTNSSTGVGLRKTMFVRVSSGWWRNAASATNLNPAASTSERKVCSAIR